ncbi:2Fe-2S iron-sulfur cluster-binding protein [Stenomitos frigidus]|uniref:(2Fe-2S)-binding protein n=1 Tax=Stenomitos frigidus ULC18 TaxID=2107698 RepID=A0A2T1EP23_9CYAN|nr:2Fe-2S iron-sulfur cluster-binding protein [Stenomitos frigidus]PSB34484.1 (2Fe-2S)-binding protein [Stenomitos frigidus ULC18]
MPTVQAEGKTFTCESGANLRQVMLDNGIDVYNGAASVINCHGLGTCGTCAVQVQGAVSEPEWREKTRLSLPPHNLENGRRLSCQVKVLGDVTVTKYDGLWGQGDRVMWTPERVV